MRVTEHPTQPIDAPVTDRHLRWPPPEDADLPSAEDLPIADNPPTGETIGHVPDQIIAAPQVHAPLPRVGEIWDLPVHTVDPAWADPAWTAAASTYGTSYRPKKRPAPGSATAAVVASSVSLPLALLGVGAVLGFLGVVLGIAALVQIGSGAQRRQGTGRAVAAIVMGTASVVVGTPILLVILAVLAII
ncbi:hypothetical protein GCM10022238_12210 [Gordonia hankookensis]